MKTVFNSNWDVAHAFNLQNQAKGRNSNGSIFFENDRIYSYGRHYIIAQFLTPEIIVINNRGYSVTTQKHINIVTSATSDKKQVFTSFGEVKQVYYKLKESRETYDKIRYKHRARNEALSLIKKFNNVVHLLGGYLTELSFTGNYIVSNENKYINEINEIYLFFQSDEVKGLCQDTEQKERDANDKRQANKAKKEREKLEALKRLLPGKIAKFRIYEINTFTGSEFTYLRISKDGTKVETSQGVKIEINEALRYYNLILSGADLKGSKISQFTFIESTNKYIRIGCHKIPMSEILNVGKDLKEQTVQETAKVF